MRHGARRLYKLLLWADPRPAMVWYALAAASFGVAVGVGDLLAGLDGTADTPVEAAYHAFGRVPGGLVGAAFAVAGAGLIGGVLRERARTTRLAALALLALWTYTAVTIPVWLAAHGSWVPTAWARYATPLVVGWWVYLRAPGPTETAVWRLLPGGRRRSGWPLLVVLVVPPVVALDLTLPGDLTATVLWGSLMSALTLLGKWLADRLRAKTDFSTAVATAAVQHTQFLIGEGAETIRRLSTELATLRGQFAEHLQLWEDRDRYCRKTCGEHYPDRP